MNIRTRRRVVLGALSATVVVLGLVTIPSAIAAGGSISGVTPNFAFNDETKTISFTTSDPMTPGSTVTFTRTGTTDSFSGSTPTPSTPGTTSSVQINFANPDGSSGPANPGTYDVSIADTAGVNTDSCSRCFTVLLRSTNPTVTATNPASVAANGSANVTVSGTGFARGSHIDVLLPDGSGPDNSIKANDPALDGSGKPITTPTTTNTTIQRRFTLGPATQAGPRIVRVTNTDGSVGQCASPCFTVNGSPLTGVSPQAATNDPNKTTSGGLTRLIFTGSNLTAGQPRLVFVGDPGSASRSTLNSDPALVGQNVLFATDGSNVAADFDLRGAAVGSSAYQPLLSQSDGSSNSCSCTFSVGSAGKLTVSSANPSSLAQGANQQVTLTGSYFSKGARVSFSGTGVTATAVTYVNPTQLNVQVQVDPSAATGARDIIATTADNDPNNAGTCTGCFTVAAAGTSGSPSASGTGTPGASGSGSPSGSASATGSPTPNPGADSLYVALSTPSRVMDSRPQYNVGTSPGLKRGTVVLDLSGQIAGSASAAVLNVTVTQPQGPGYLTAYPDGTTRPPTSNVNYAKGQTQANEVIAALSTAKKADLYVTEDAYVVVDLVGYLTTDSTTAGAARVANITPVRAFDQRMSGSADVDVSHAVPATSTAAVVNLTVTNLTGAPDAYLVAYPSGGPQPGTSNVNVLSSDTQANEAFVRLGTGTSTAAGKLRVTLSRGTARVIVDVVGYVGPNAAGTQVYTPLSAPIRVMDSRNGTGTPQGRKTASQPAVLTVPSSIPADATGVVLNATATGAATNAVGYLVVYPNGQSQPPTSNIDWKYPLTQANEVLAQIGSNRQIVLMPGGNQVGTGVNIVVDVVGYLTTHGAAAPASASASPTGAPTATSTASAGASGTPAPSSSASGGGGGVPCNPSGVPC